METVKKTYGIIGKGFSISIKKTNSIVYFKHDVKKSEYVTNLVKSHTYIACYECDSKNIQDAIESTPEFKYGLIFIYKKHINFNELISKKNKLDLSYVIKCSCCEWTDRESSVKINKVIDDIKKIKYDKLICPICESDRLKTESLLSLYK